MCRYIRLIFLNGLQHSPSWSLQEVSVIYVSSHSDSFWWTACTLTFNLYRKWVSLTCPHIWFVLLNDLHCPSRSLQKVSAAYVSSHCLHYMEQLVLNFSISTNSKCLCVSHRPHLAELLVLPFFISTGSRLHFIISDSFCWLTLSISTPSEFHVRVYESSRCIHRILTNFQHIAILDRHLQCCAL